MTIPIFVKKKLKAVSEKVTPSASDYVLIHDVSDDALKKSLISSLPGGAGEVSSVFGRTGAVVAAPNDYTWSQIDKTTSSIADITTKSHTLLTDIGTNTHAQIDTHIANTSNPHSVTAAQLGLVIGTNVQAWSANLDEYAAVNPTAAGLALLDDATAGDQRTTLGLGTLATQSGTFSGTSSGTNTGDQSSIVGITGTKAQFDTAVSDGNIVFVGDLTAGNITGATLAANVLASSLTSVGTLIGGATGAGFTVALGTSTLTGDLPFANLAQLTANAIAANATGSTADMEALTIAANTFPARSSSGNMAAKTITDFGLSLVDDANAAAAIATLGLNTDLATFALPASTTISAFGASLIDDAAASNAITTLGLDNTKIASVGITIDGGGSAITTGVKGYIMVPYGCTINSVTLLADQSGSIVIDIWKDTYANYPPIVADTITASAKPTITTATKSQDTTLTGWTTSVSAGDVIGFNVDSASTVTRVHLILKVTKT